MTRKPAARARVSCGPRLSSARVAVSSGVQRTLARPSVTARGASRWCGVSRAASFQSEGALARYFPRSAPVVCDADRSPCWQVYQMTALDQKGARVRIAPSQHVALHLRAREPASICS